MSSLSTAILTGQPVPGSSLEGDLRSLGFDVRLAGEAGDAETLLAAVPADQRVAVVDARFVGHLHALRLGLTDPRFAASALPGAVSVQPEARRALTRAVARESSASGSLAVATDNLAERLTAALDADGVAVFRPSSARSSPRSPPTRRSATRPGRPSPPWTTRPYACAAR